MAIPGNSIHVPLLQKKGVLLTHVLSDIKNKLRLDKSIGPDVSYVDLVRLIMKANHLKSIRDPHGFKIRKTLEPMDTVTRDLKAMR